MVPAFELIIKGFILGLTVSMPLGPIGILLINRTIKRGILSGFFSGLGLAAADTILAIIAAFGFSIVISFVNEEKFLVGLVSGIVIIAVGIKIFLSNPVKDIRNRDKNSKSLLRDFLTVLALALSSPFTIIVFVAFFSGIHSTTTVEAKMVPFYLVPGVFVGTLTWWGILSIFIGRFKTNIRLRNIVRINQIAGLIIFILGVVILISLFATARG
jgi:threonine/homoserine/homoserine lactone efflux protein